MAVTLACTVRTLMESRSPMAACLSSVSTSSRKTRSSPGVNPYCSRSASKGSCAGSAGSAGYTDTVMRRMILVTDHIRNNLTADDLSQGAMAKLAGISKDYFSRIFRSVTGMNYSRWLNMIRLEKATELLADKQMTLTEIAMHSGFQSISSFNRVFHTEKGMSPGEYRALLMPPYPG